MAPGGGGAFKGTNGPSALQGTNGSRGRMAPGHERLEQKMPFSMRGMDPLAQGGRAWALSRKAWTLSQGMNPLARGWTLSRGLGPLAQGLDSLAMPGSSRKAWTLSRGLDPLPQGGRASEADASHSRPRIMGWSLPLKAGEGRLRPLRVDWGWMARAWKARAWKAQPGLEGSGLDL